VSELTLVLLIFCSWDYTCAAGFTVFWEIKVVYCGLAFKVVKCADSEIAIWTKVSSELFLSVSHIGNY